MTAILGHPTPLTTKQKHRWIVFSNQPAHIHIRPNLFALFGLSFIKRSQTVKRDIPGIKILSRQTEHRLPLKYIIGKLTIARPRRHNARRLAKHGIFTIGIGQIIVKSQPHRSPRTGRATIRSDAFGIDVPRLGIVPDKLHRTRCIAQNILYGRSISKPVINRRK